MMQMLTVMKEIRGVVFDLFFYFSIPTTHFTVKVKFTYNLDTLPVRPYQQDDEKTKPELQNPVSRVQSN